jgi:DnaJ-domain-containing protein 1
MEMSPTQVGYLLISVVGVFLLSVFALKALFGPKNSSQFRVREWEKRTNPESRDPKMERPKAAPLRLTGYREGISPEELFGLKGQFTAREIDRAYRELMKQYHPDVFSRSGLEGARAEAVRISARINEARQTLLKKISK